MQRTLCIVRDFQLNSFGRSKIDFWLSYGQVFWHFQQNWIKTFRIRQTTGVLNFLVCSCCGLANSHGLNQTLWKVHVFSAFIIGDVWIFWKNPFAHLFWIKLQFFWIFLRAAVVVSWIILVRSTLSEISSTLLRRFFR